MMATVGTGKSTAFMRGRVRDSGVLSATGIMILGVGKETGEGKKEKGRLTSRVLYIQPWETKPLKVCNL